MFITGTKEWVGKPANIFWETRTKIEKELLDLEYEYFHGGIVSKKSIYEKYYHILGSNFKNIIVDISVLDKKYILSPEYTFRVYDYISRNNLLNENKKFFYSQEMLRNETKSDVEKGKTFSFWQIGYEIFGKNDKNLFVENVSTLFRCMKTVLPSDDFCFRITDKRILQALCKRHIIDSRIVLDIMEQCDEDADQFYVNYLSQGGNKDFANEFCQLLTLSKSNILTIHILRNLLNTVIEDDILDNLETVQNELINICNGIKIIIVPAMPKTWEAYTTYMFDVRVCGYNKAIAGGDSLKINPTEEMNFHSGAGIGVTRIAEHLIATEIDLDIQ